MPWRGLRLDALARPVDLRGRRPPELGEPDAFGRIAGVQRTCIELLVSRSSAGLARRVSAALTTSNAAAVEEVLLRIGPAGKRALADRIRKDAPEEAG